MRFVAFPEKFKWGVATSAHQIEGAFSEDGRGESIWDRFEAAPGNIEDGSDASIACDHYHRWKEDVELMKWLGVDAYRFSIAWPRVMPDGKHENPRGLDFYDSLVDALLNAGIEPFVTLYHWDLPQSLQEMGGWASREVAQAFVEYAGIVARRLGDRVKHWMTHNEPWCIAFLGHEEGEHAPGHRDPIEALWVAHHLLLSHGWASEAIRANVYGGQVGIVLNLVPAKPASNSELDLEAARRFDGSFNRWFLGPIFKGSYPDDVIADRVKMGHLRGFDLPFVMPGDLDVIGVNIDFLGVNYYSRVVVKGGRDGAPEIVKTVPPDELTEMGWEVFPEGLYEILMRLKNEYNVKRIYITENGAAYPDQLDKSGQVKDEKRIEYLKAHILMAKRSIDSGVPLEGYFVWSLYDNFEWAHGYTKRFGLFWVDFATQKRIPKQSAFWYKEVIAANGLPIE